MIFLHWEEPGERQQPATAPTAKRQQLIPMPVWRGFKVVGPRREQQK